MKLILISNPDSNIYHEIETIVELFAHGLTYFHVRKPNFSEVEYEYFIMKIPQEHRNKLIIHNYHHLTEKYNLKGIHFSSYTKNSPLFKELQQEIYQSKSCHSLEEITQVKNQYNYVFLSPIFNSISKKDYPAKFNKQELTNFLTNRKELPEIIALGGIESTKIAEIKAMGFQGIAILGTIWQEKNPATRLKVFQEIQTKLLNSSC